MIKNFEQNIVLTSQNPEAYLTFKWETGDASGVIDVSININASDLYINGWDAQTLYPSMADPSLADTSAGLNFEENNLASFHLFTDSLEDFEYDLKFILSPTVGSDVIYDVSIYNRPFLLDANEFNTYDTFNSLVDNEASYLLLRTNPKYSGNVKLMIDVSENMYLDTFKVSDILSNKKYRRQTVSGNSFLSGDIRRVFSSLPKGEIFRVAGSDTLNISNPKTEYYDQYNTRYNYGAKILIDELYPEEYAILAPLWINSKIPDYFSVFRLPGNFNSETYDGADLSNLAYDFITNSDLIESWNLKADAPIGTYLNNHLTELLKVQSPVNLSLNEYDANTWNGIAVDKGIIAGRSEVPYFFQKTSDNFTNLNAFVSQGFERNNLLCPNLLNMEFVFNDPDVSLYTMQRYFGLYLTENELYKLSYYSNEVDSSVRIISLDGKNVLNFADSSIFNSDGTIAFDYENRIIVLNDGKDLNRIYDTNEFNGTKTHIEQYLNKLGKNIFNTPVIKKEINTFITLKINNLLHQGEHLRVINKTSNKIWEVYGTETELLNAGEAGPYVSYNEPSVGYPDLYRTSFSVLGDISDQANAIRNAFSMFADYEESSFSVGMGKENGLSLIIDESSNDEYVFQRLTAQVAYAIGYPNSIFNLAAEPGDISFYNQLTPSNSDYTRMPFDASYGPIDFELYGDRLSIIVPMINTSNYNVYSFDSSVSLLFTDNVLYDAIDGWNRLIVNFNADTEISHQYQWVEDPTSELNESLVITDYEIDVDDFGVWWGYDVYPLSVSIMGINSVKDIDFTVYDSSTSGMDFKSNYFDAHENDEYTYRDYVTAGDEKIITARNSYIIIEGQGSISIDGSTLDYNAFGSDYYFNTFFGSATISADVNTQIRYNILDGSHEYTSYDSSISEELIYDYYADNYYYDSSDNAFKDLKNLKYGLTIPTISKWGMLGQDVRNNQVRLNLTPKFFDNSSQNSNFIPMPDSSLYSDEITFPIFKYMYTDNNNAWKDYVYYDINDVVDGSTKMTVRDLIFNEPTSDIFSKIIFNNNAVSGNVNRSSILYYSLYENQVIAILKGLKVGFSVTPTGEKTLNVTNWDRYKFSIVTSPSRNINNNYPIEVFINENTETILMIWYQGNDILNYTYKWSSFLPGKSNLFDQWDVSVDKRFQSFDTSLGSPEHSFVKSPFLVNTSVLNTPIYNQYDISTNYDSSVATPLGQFNYNINTKINSVFNANSLLLGDNVISGGLFTFNQSFDTFNQVNVDYNFGNDSISYGNSISNLASNYNNNYNWYQNNTCEYETLKFILNNNNVQYYIIQDDGVTSSQQFSSQPIEVNIFSPVLYESPNGDSSIYTYNGGYTPIFRNILSFADNEDSKLINTVEKDFVFGNTNLQEYENIYQFWFNRVVETVTVSDTSNNILFKENYNPFKSQWDSGYYTLSSGNVETSIDGYESSLELPAFFGSKLISLPNELSLDLWNASNSKVIPLASYYQLEFNLTKSIVDLFTRNATFVNNWGELPSVNDDIINRYIIKTILSYYNISINKIKPTVYDKVYNGQILYTKYDSSFENEIKNLDTQLSLINNEYIYKMKFDNTLNKSYFAKFTFTRI